MIITYYTLDENFDEEVEVGTWREATHCIIDIEQDSKEEDLFAAGMWVEKHKRTIADYSLHESKADCPYIEVFKLKK